MHSSKFAIKEHIFPIVSMPTKNRKMPQKTYVCSSINLDQIAKKFAPINIETEINLKQAFLLVH